MSEFGLAKNKITFHTFSNVVGHSLSDLKDSNSVKESLLSLIMQAFQEHLVNQLICSDGTHLSKSDSFRQDSTTSKSSSDEEQIRQKRASKLEKKKAEKDSQMLKDLSIHVTR